MDPAVLAARSFVEAESWNADDGRLWCPSSQEKGFSEEATETADGVLRV